MSLFLATFLSLYGGMHLYLFLKVRAPFHLGTTASVLLACWLLLMTFAPMLVHVAERHSTDSVARVAAAVAYVWMGFIFLFTVSAAGVDLWRGAALLLGKFAPTLTLPGLTPRQAFLLPALAGVLCTCWGIYEARAIRTERVTVRTDRLPPGRDRLRIVQVSDVHIGLMLRKGRLATILDAVRAASPDLLVCTGDAIDGEPGDELPLVAQFATVPAPLGKFAVTGNHEVYAGVGRCISFLERSGFRVLRGEVADVGDMLVAGVDDPARGWKSPSPAGNEEELLRRLPPGRFVLLLKHRPAVAPGALGRFDLQLSGHVHGGQMFPFGILTRLFYPIPTGYSRLGERSAIYVNRGTGTWGPPVRFLVPPEITVIDLVRNSP